MVIMSYTKGDSNNDYVIIMILKKSQSKDCLCNGYWFIAKEIYRNLDTSEIFSECSKAESFLILMYQLFFLNTKHYPTIYDVNNFQ